MTSFANSIIWMWNHWQTAPSIRGGHFSTWPWILLKSHPRWLILAPIKSTYGTSYWSSIVTLVLSCRIPEILEFLYAESHFSIPTPIPAKILKCSPWNRSVMLESAESEHPKLTNCEIIFEDFQPIWSRYLNVTDRQMDRRTDGQRDDLP